MAYPYDTNVIPTWSDPGPTVTPYQTPSPTPSPQPNQWQYNPATGTYSSGGTGYANRYESSPITPQSQYDQWYANISDAANSLATYVKNKIIPPAYSAPNTSGINQPAQSYRPTPQPQQSQGAPSNYTGYYQGTPYVGGTIQTAGGGFTPDGSYSAGYHGGGGHPSKDTIPEIYVNGTIQTRGGGFTPDGSYSAGYHGSGEHPEISGESTPGQYQSGSFGSILSPDFSNRKKVSDWLSYVASMGFDVSGVDRNKLERQYYDSNDNFDGLAFLKTLPQANPEKTNLISQYAGNKMMPTKDVFNLLGGSGFSNLFAPASYEQYTSMLNNMFNIGGTGQKPPEEVKSKVKSLKDISPEIQNQLFTNYVNPYATNYYNNDQEKLKNFYNV